MTLEEEKYIKCYQFCLEQGWVHNTPKIDVVNDYFDLTKGRNVLFENHLNKLLNIQQEELHILIGEAPPYYPNKEFPIDSNRKYFYNHNHSPATDYFRQPYKYFVNSLITKFIRDQKQHYLSGLAENGVLIFDIFPFPVYQSTKIRQTINLIEKDKKTISSFYLERKKNNAFNTYLNDWFEPRLKSLLYRFPPHTKINLYLFAPKYASVQFLYWIISKKEFVNHLVKFNGNFILNSKKLLTIDLEKFIKKLADGEKEDIERLGKALINHPIFMNDTTGNPNFKSFVNGHHK